MSEELPGIPEIYGRGIENLKKKGIDWVYPPGRKTGPAVKVNRKYLDSLFFTPQFLKTVKSETGFTFLQKKFRGPVFCSAISRLPFMPETSLAEIARGTAEAGSFIMLGIGGSDELQSAIDTGASVIKMVKPYRNMELTYEKVRDAESRGCLAVGMDIDHFYGVMRGNTVRSTELFGPYTMTELKQVIAQTRLPFIIKGVLSAGDAAAAVELGASAILVSNHGSGSMDFSAPSVLVLENIASSVGDRVEVLVDSGFENGNDVFKALAFGARAAGFGSPMILAWAADGSKGVAALINLINAELRRAMTATGCASLTAIDKSLIFRTSLFTGGEI